SGVDYPLIPTVSDIATCGTSATGLIHATEQLSQGRFCLVPLQTSYWLDALATVWALCHTHPDWQAIPLLNLQTGYLWGSHLTPGQLSTYLQTGQLSPPPTDWSVGHFALLVGQIQGEPASTGLPPRPAPNAQGNSHPLYAVLDTYPHFGWHGLHLQPPAALAQALQRPQQPTQGGIAMFVATEFQPQLIAIAEQAGLQIAAWDNGSPVPVSLV
ncbi:MAG: hypothetical protein F6K42_06295, partial [Leptolyngbya sp. SIO1D8]|nr:hypothetical protein [Leptolyngbya sp. SIO1D8]